MKWQVISDSLIRSLSLVHSGVRVAETSVGLSDSDALRSSRLLLRRVPQMLIWTSRWNSDVSLSLWVSSSGFTSSDVTVNSSGLLHYIHLQHFHQVICTASSAFAVRVSSKVLCVFRPTRLSGLASSVSVKLRKVSWLLQPQTRMQELPRSDVCVCLQTGYPACTGWGSPGSERTLWPPSGELRWLFSAAGSHSDIWIHGRCVSAVSHQWRRSQGCCTPVVLTTAPQVYS